MNETELRKRMVETCRKMNKAGINQGTSGNLSARCGDGFLITPSSLPYDEMNPSDLVEMDFDGTYVGRLPSSEWRFHRDILNTHTDSNIVLHCHSVYATTLACHHRDIPAFHYMVGIAGGTTIRCSEYATFGTQELSNAYPFDEVFMISAEKGHGVKDLMSYLAKMVPEGPWLYPDDQIADVPLKLIASETTREKLMLRLHQELPYFLSS